jgi:hypothetical protein
VMKGVALVTEGKMKSASERASDLPKPQVRCHRQQACQCKVHCLPASLRACVRWCSATLTSRRRREISRFLCRSIFPELSVPPGWYNSLVVCPTRGSQFRGLIDEKTAPSFELCSALLYSAKLASLCLIFSLSLLKGAHAADTCPAVLEERIGAFGGHVDGILILRGSFV